MEWVGSERRRNFLAGRCGSVWFGLVRLGSSRKTSLWIAATTEPLRFLPGELGDKGADGLLLGPRPEPAPSLPQPPTTKSPTEPGEGPDEALARAEAVVGPAPNSRADIGPAWAGRFLPAPPDRGPAPLVPNASTETVKS